MKKKKQKNITKKTKLSKLIREHPGAIGVLFEKGMYCVGCPASQDETVEEAAMAHGLNVDELVKEMNGKI